MSDKHAVLLVDDNAEFLRSVATAVGGVFEVLTASDAATAKRRIGPRVSAILLDVRLDDSMPANKDGLALLSWFRDHYPDTPVIMMTAVEELGVAVDAMKLGASDFLVKTRFHLPELTKAVNAAIERSQLVRRLTNLEKRLEVVEPTDLIGQSASIVEVRRLIDVVASDGQCSVLIRGDTGTGKELVARAIHKRGVRKDAPFVAASLPSLPKEMVARELFGHERGAFTGADRRSIGYVEAAAGGVLFVDEIGDLPLDMQVSLLRVFESREVVRVGATKPVAVDFQLVAATHRDLEAAVSAGTFREDLYYRLRAVEIVLPPLRDRRDDVVVLAAAFLESLRQSGRTTIRTISPEAQEYLRNHAWPGNVRELRNCIDTAVLRARLDNDDVIAVAHLPIETGTGDGAARLHARRSVLSSEIPTEGLSIEKELARAELTLISEALRKTDGRVAEAARLLGYHDRFTVRRRVKTLFAQFPELADDFRALKR
jgi:DNA-binding NtrC family response regulator